MSTNTRIQIIIGIVVLVGVALVFGFDSFDDETVADVDISETDDGLGGEGDSAFSKTANALKTIQKDQQEILSNLALAKSDMQQIEENEERLAEEFKELDDSVESGEGEQAEIRLEEITVSIDLNREKSESARQRIQEMELQIEQLYLKLQALN